MARHLLRSRIINHHLYIIFVCSDLSVLLTIRIIKETSLIREVSGVCFWVIRMVRKDGEFTTLIQRRYFTLEMLCFFSMDSHLHQFQMKNQTSRTNWILRYNLLMMTTLTRQSKTPMIQELLKSQNPQLNHLLRLITNRSLQYLTKRRLMKMMLPRSYHLRVLNTMSPTEKKRILLWIWQTLTRIFILWNPLRSLLLW